MVLFQGRGLLVHAFLLLKHGPPSMKKTKRQASAQYLPLTPEQVQAVTLAWQAILDTHLPGDVVWLAALLEKEAGAWYLRAFLETQTKNISLDRCAELNRLLDDKLDTLPLPANCAYHLEISSPGLFRELTTPKELAFYQGEPVRVVREGHAPLEGTLGTVQPILPDGDMSAPSSHVATLDLILTGQTTPVTLNLTPDLTITLNYPLTNLEDAADD
jgi:RimP N-terminal domain